MTKGRMFQYAAGVFSVAALAYTAWQHNHPVQPPPEDATNIVRKPGETVTDAVMRREATRPLRPGATVQVWPPVERNAQASRAMP
jgi:hypothetical protein